MKNSPEVLIRLNNRVDQLEQRVFRLEHPDEVVAACTVPTPNTSDLQPQQALETPSFAQTGTVFPVVGKAMLGMAGAYVLRAIADIGSVPKLAIVVLAIAYAGMWLIYAARVTAGPWFNSAIYSGTSALILAPMLWELTFRFKF